MHSSMSATDATGNPPLQKLPVFVYWDQGWDKAPEVCLMCRRHITRFADGHPLHFIDKNQLPEYLPELWQDHRSLLTTEQLIPQHQADMIRLCLLAKHGGIWMDSTVLCVKPIDEWLATYRDQQFFVFPFVRDNQYACSNWFIYSSSNHPLTMDWRDDFLQRITKNLRQQVKIDYFTMHQSFDDLVKRHPHQSRWQKMLKFPHRDCSVFSHHSPTTDDLPKLLATCPLFKLNHPNGSIQRDILQHPTLKALLRHMA